MAHNKGNEIEPRIYSFARTSCAILTHCVCIAFTVLIAVLSQPGTSWFSWHPFFMSLAFSLFMTEAIMVFSPNGSPIRALPHQTKGRIHWTLQCLCVTCSVLGLAAIFYNKELNNKGHFTSWHGLVGLATVCAVIVQSLAALPLIFNSLVKGWSLAKLKRYHATAGLITYILGSVSVYMGICSAWFTASVAGYRWYLAALCPALSALVIMNQVTSAYMNKKRFKS